MPYYKWQGIDLSGKIHTGTLFAKDTTHLDAVLFKQGVALLSNKQARPSLWLSITINHKIDLLRHLNELLNAGVLLPEALEILGSQPQHASLRTVLNELSCEVHSGGNIAHAFKKYPKVFDSVTVHMIYAGQESGQLPKALEAATIHLEMMNDFRKRMRAALLMPLCTFIFFAFVAFIILVCIVPQYVSIFSSVQQELPSSTKALIAVSGFLSEYSILIAGFVGAIIAALFAYIQSKKGKHTFDRILLQIPVVGRLITQSLISNFLGSIALLVQHGVRLVPAIKIANATISNSTIQSHVESIAEQVESGVSLSRAMMHDPARLFGDDIITIARVGEESGQLAPLLIQAAKSYQDRVRRSLHFVSTTAQPVLVVMLGLLITALIFAIYMPIFNLSHAL